MVDRRRKSKFRPDQAVTLKILGMGKARSIPARIIDKSGSALRLGTTSPVACGCLVEMEAERLVVHGSVAQCLAGHNCYEVGIYVATIAAK